jgi:hypothetical protein
MKIDKELARRQLDRIQARNHLRRNGFIDLTKLRGNMGQNITHAAPHGWFENPQGYSLTWLRNERYAWLFTKAIYEFQLNLDSPLTFHHPDGRRIQPDRHVSETDMGSVPLTLQMWIPKDRYLLAFLFHDSGYDHGGLYVALPGQEQFGLAVMSRLQLDELLRLMCRAQGAWWTTAAAIYRAVRIGGAGAYQPA